jgi:hypothetical protein
VNILDTFYILFKSNTAEVKEATASAEAGAVSFGASMEHVDEIVTKFGEQAAHVFEYVGERLAAFFAFEELGRFTTEQAEVNAQLLVTSERLGINIEDLGAWQQATVRAGGSAEGLTATLDFLNRNLAGLNTPGGTSRIKPFLEELKIDPHKITDSLSLLTLLSDKSKELGAQKFSGIAERFGIDPGTQILISKGSAELAKQIQYQKELGVTTKEQAEQAHKYEQAIDDLSHRFHYYATLIGDEVLPTLQKFFDWLGEASVYLGEHKALVEGFFAGIAGVITILYLPAMARAILATIALAIEWLAIPLAIAAVGLAIGLVYEDVQAFVSGHKSLIGQLSKQWPELGEDVRKAVAVMGEVWEWFLELFRGGASFLTGMFRLIVVGAEAFGKGVGGAIGWITTSLTNAFPEIGTIIHAIGALFDWLGEKIAYVVKHIPSILLKWGTDANKLADVGDAKLRNDPNAGAMLNKYKSDDYSNTLARMKAHGWDIPDINSNIARGTAQLNTADFSPYNAQTPGAVADSKVDKSKIVNLSVEPGAVVINANGADPAAVHSIFEDKLSDHIGQLLNHWDDGVKS